MPKLTLKAKATPTPSIDRVVIEQWIKDFTLKLSNASIVCRIAGDDDTAQRMNRLISDCDHVLTMWAIEQKIAVREAEYAIRRSQYNK